MNIFTPKNISSAWTNCLQCADKLSDMRVLIPLVSLAYCVGYFFYPARPGNSLVYPQGWWGWFDQGKYLLEAISIAHGDWSPEKYFYPPLYPALGAIFVRWWSRHPFVLVNLVCFLTFFIIFHRLACLWVRKSVAFGLFSLSVLANLMIFQNFIIPWSSNISAALLSIVIYGLIRLWEFHQRKSLQEISYVLVMCVGLAAGMIVTARPLDALVAGVLWLVFCGQLWCIYAERNIARIRRVKLLVVSTVALGVGPLLFIGFNIFLYGTVLGSYVNATTGNGYYPADLAEKFLSLVLDGYSLYLEPKSGLIQHYPWLLLSLLGMLSVLARGNWLLKALVVAICLQFALYFPYGDLLPNGLWRYLNIHYFKWTFPYLALLAWLLPVFIIDGWRSGKLAARLITILILVCIMLPLCLRFEISTRDVAFTGGGASEQGVAPIVIDLPDEQVDFIDIRKLNGGFQELYFGAGHIWIDGVELHWVKDFRILPAIGGLRILFIRPVKAKSITYQPDIRIPTPTQALSIAIGKYRIVLGAPTWFGREKSRRTP